MSRLVVALGGNAIAPADTGGSAPEQTATITRAAGPLADLVAEGHDLVLTHGNGPQVGNLLLKNELAADIVPAMPLDWCVAQTQATIGFTIATALEAALRERGIDRPVVPVVSRVRVDADDPAFDHPTKPIGKWRPDGTRRLVPSPEPVELLDERALRLLLDGGALVVAAGGGGIPMTADDDGHLAGIEAVIDKDLCADLLARSVGASRLVILTDVVAVAVDWGSPDQRDLGSVTARELRALIDGEGFPAGSMGPKVEAATRFVERGGATAAIGGLDDVAAVVAGSSGTQIRP
ncbi:MAG: carbamate kinase [Actinomycetota bacterium]